MNWSSAELIAITAALFSLGSVLFAALSWQAAKVQAQGALFQERYKVFLAAKEFLRPWFSNGYPDLNELDNLVAAREKSIFLFDEPVTNFLRHLGLDALVAAHDHKIVTGEVEGDRAKAIERSAQLKQKYLFGDADEPPALFEAFKSMKLDH
jgi:hypothetical protein